MIDEHIANWKANGLSGSVGISLEELDDPDAAELLVRQKTDEMLRPLILAARATCGDIEARQELGDHAAVITPLAREVAQ